MSSSSRRQDSATGSAEAQRPSRAALSRAVHAVPQRRGTMLVALVIVLVMIQLFVIGIALLGTRDQHLTSRRFDSDKAYYAAEGALNMAIREVVAQSDGDGDGTIGSIGGNVVASGPSIGGAQAAVGVSAASQTYNLTATGLSNSAEHILTLQLVRTVGAGLSAGLYTEYYNLGSSPGAVNNINWAGTPNWIGVMPNADIPYVSGTARWPSGPAHQYGIRMRGNVNIPTAGTWTFYTFSDDGSLLYINGTLVVNNDYDHAGQTSSGTITLPAGPATFDLRFYENGGVSNCTAYWSGPGISSQTVIPATAFTCTPLQTLPPLAGDTSVILNGYDNSGSTFIDAYNPDSGAYGGSNILTSGYGVQTNSTSSNMFSVTKTYLKGNAICGPGGSTGTVIQTNTGGSITGSKSVAASGVVPMTVNIPAFMPSSTSGAGNGTVTISSNQHYSSYTYSGTNAVTTISGNVFIQVDGNFAMSSNTKIVLNANATLTLLVGGTFTMSNTSSLNSGGNPSSVSVYMTGSSGDVTLNNSAQLYAYIFNPVGQLSIAGGSTPAPQFFGVFHGTSVNLQSNGLIHADSTFGSTSGGTTTTAVSGWTQTN